MPIASTIAARITTTIIIDPERAIIQVANFLQATRQVAQTTLGWQVARRLPL